MGPEGAFSSCVDRLTDRLCIEGAFAVMSDIIAGLALLVSILALSGLRSSRRAAEAAEASAASSKTSADVRLTSGLGV